MPQVPSQNNLGVLPQPAEAPRMTPADFGAGKFDELQQASVAMSRVGTELEKLDRDTSRAKARAAYMSYRQGMDQTLQTIQSQPTAQAALGSMDAFNDSADELMGTQRDSLKDDPTARDLFDSMAAPHRAQMAGEVLDYQKSALDTFEKEQAAGQLNMSARDYAAEDDPDKAAAHLQEVYGLTHGIVRGFGASAPGEASSVGSGGIGESSTSGSGGEAPENNIPSLREGQGVGVNDSNYIPYDESAHHAAVQSVLAPAIAGEVHARATGGDFDGALTVLKDKGGWLNPDVRDQMTQNIRESKTQQTVSDYLNCAAHPDKVQSLVDSIDDPALKSVAQEMAPGIISAKQNALDRQHAQVMGAEMQKIQSDPSGYAPADPLLDEGQKAVLTTYKNKLLQDAAGPKADDSAAWSNLRFMAIDNPSGFVKIDPTDPRIQNAISGDHFGQFVKLQNDIKTGDFDATATPAQSMLQDLLHSDKNLATPVGGFFLITPEGHQRLATTFREISRLNEDDQNDPAIIKKIWQSYE